MLEAKEKAMQKRELAVAEMLKRDGHGGCGHGLDIWPSVVTCAGCRVGLAKEASLSGAQKEYFFLTTGA